MKLVAPMPVRNEAWVLGLSARVALMWCDDLCVLNHASTDATVDILADLQREFPDRVHIVSVPEAQWSEMQHRQFLLELARAKGATHIAIVDADEVLTNTPDLMAPRSPRMLDGATTHYTGIYEMVHDTPPGHILQLPGYNMRCTIDRFHSSGTWGKRWFSLAFKDDERLHWSASHRNGYDHHHREPFGMNLTPYRPVAQGRGGIMHLWGVTERRMTAKHALYKVTEALRWPERDRAAMDRMYSLGVKGNPPHEMPDGWQFQKAPDEWWAPYAHLMKYLDLNAEPWQEAECRRLVAEHGAERFKGLDLFGVA